MLCFSFLCRVELCNLLGFKYLIVRTQKCFLIVNFLGVIMLIDSMSLSNFRGYKEKTVIEFGKLTALVGRNDIGKSTILEALEIFFNEESPIVKPDVGDLNVFSANDGVSTFEIAVSFTDLPERVILDSNVETDLRSEYLLNPQGKLEIVKKYKKTGKPSIFIKALHPTNKKCSDLLIKKNSELKSLAEKEGAECPNKSVNTQLRRAIWEKFKDELDLQEVEIDASKEDAKNIYEKISSYLPIYSLFQSDRKNTDNDNEVQDPLKEAVKQILGQRDIQKQLAAIAKTVETELKNVAKKTLEKLREIDCEVASSLNPVIPTSDALKWNDVFKGVSIAGDNDIPINKRGSGVKRLILLSFFRAQSERSLKGYCDSDRSIIYAIEEPETSQHHANQKLLIGAFKTLSQREKVQIILTTHSSLIVKNLNFENIRLIRNDGLKKVVEQPGYAVLKYPSLNEINFVAYEEVSAEYHNELYSFIEFFGLRKEFTKGKKTRKYIRINKDGSKEEWNLTNTEYIRHQIHHPENKENKHYTTIELKNSIEEMRDFLSSKKDLLYSFMESEIKESSKI